MTVMVAIILLADWSQCLMAFKQTAIMHMHAQPWTFQHLSSFSVDNKTAFP